MDQSRWLPAAGGRIDKFTSSCCHVGILLTTNSQLMTWFWSLTSRGAPLVTFAVKKQRCPGILSRRIPYPTEKEGGAEQHKNNKQTFQSRNIQKSFVFVFLSRPISMFFNNECLLKRKINEIYRWAEAVEKRPSILYLEEILLSFNILSILNYTPEEEKFRPPDRYESDPMKKPQI